MTLSIVSMLEASAFQHSFECFALIEEVSFSTFFNIQKKSRKGFPYHECPSGHSSTMVDTTVRTIFANQKGSQFWRLNLCNFTFGRMDSSENLDGKNCRTRTERVFLDIAIRSLRYYMLLTELKVAPPTN